MSFRRHLEIYPSDGGAILHDRAPAHRLDEFPAGYSLAGCAPALPASASPTASEYAVKSSCRSISFQRTANSVLTTCVTRGGKRILCAPGDLSMYIGLGSTGCDVGSATFSGFQTLPVITGAQAIAAGDVTISPFQSGDVIGLDVQFSETANSGQLLQALIGYTVAGPLFIGNSIAVSGSSATGGRFVTDIQNSCLVRNYLPGGVSGCTGIDVTLLVLNSGMDQRTFSGGFDDQSRTVSTLSTLEPPDRPVVVS